MQRIACSCPIPPATVSQVPKLNSETSNGPRPKRRYSILSPESIASKSFTRIHRVPHPSRLFAKGGKAAKPESDAPKPHSSIQHLHGSLAQQILHPLHPSLVR